MRQEFNKENHIIKKIISLLFSLHKKQVKVVIKKTSTHLPIYDLLNMTGLQQIQTDSRSAKLEANFYTHR